MGGGLPGNPECRRLFQFFQFFVLIQCINKPIIRKISIPRVEKAFFSENLEFWVMSVVKAFPVFFWFLNMSLKFSLKVEKIRFDTKI